MTPGVNFQALRAALDFEQMLEFYGVVVKRRGNRHHGYCPLPDHNGKRNSPSFSAHLERGIFHCFGCGAKGNVLEFAVLMEGADPEDGRALRDVALKLQQMFCPHLAHPDGQAARLLPPKSPTHPEPKSPDATPPVAVNEPLSFELKRLDYEHPYLLNRGFSPAIIRHFGLGYCSHGLLNGRIAIPLHDAASALIGYAGRVVDDSAINENNPRYRFPGRRTQNGKIVEFRKSQFLYNGHRIQSPVNDLIVVEGFASVWWLAQHGFPATVATMGADCSPAQADLIVSLVNPSGRIWISPDGDRAGERHAQLLLTLLSPHRFVRWVKLADGQQPTDLAKQQFKSIFTF